LFVWNIYFLLSILQQKFQLFYSMKSSRLPFHVILQLSVFLTFLLFFAGAAPEPITTLAPSPGKTQMSAGLLALLIILAHLTIIGLIPLMFASLWTIFEKSGEKGWKALIPFYSTYILWKISGAKLWAGITAIVASIIWYIANYLSNIALQAQVNVPLGVRIMALFAFIAGVIADVAISFKLSEKFGQTEGFAIGLLLLPTIFYPILAFIKAQ
jgi:hypothetical protein